MTAIAQPGSLQDLEQICHMTLAEARKILDDERAFPPVDAAIDALEDVAPDRHLIDLMRFELLHEAKTNAKGVDHPDMLEGRQAIAAEFERVWEDRSGGCVPRQSALEMLLLAADHVQDALQNLADAIDSHDRQESARAIVARAAEAL
jgi:hypothetical protein